MADSLSFGSFVAAVRALVGFPGVRVASFEPLRDLPEGATWAVYFEFSDGTLIREPLFGATIAKPESSSRLSLYRGGTYELPASSIIAEAQGELLDNAAYWFIAWCRLERLRQELDRVRPPSGQGLP